MVWLKIDIQKNCAWNPNLFQIQIKPLKCVTVSGSGIHYKHCNYLHVLSSFKLTPSITKLPHSRMNGFFVEIWADLDIHWCCHLILKRTKTMTGQSKALRIESFVNWLSAEWTLGSDMNKVSSFDLLFSEVTSVATKIENGPRTNMKILWFLKMDQR